MKLKKVLDKNMNTTAKRKHRAVYYAMLALCYKDISAKQWYIERIIEALGIDIEEAKNYLRSLRLDIDEGVDPN